MNRSEATHFGDYTDACFVQTMINLSVPAVGLLVGAAILLLGRKLFWLFVAAVGFALGPEIAPQIIPHPAPTVTLVVALALGLIGALVAFLVQKFAIGASGFLAGGWLAIRLSALIVGYVRNTEIVFIAGGILGAILFVVLFDGALILFSSLVGARLIATAVLLPQSGRAILFIMLVVAGVAVQSKMLSPTRRSARR